MEVKLKDRNELDFEHWKRFTCFDEMMTKSNVVTYIINQNIELKETYLIYQNLFKYKSKDMLLFILNQKHTPVSEYMKTSLKTLNEFKNYICNNFENTYHNGFIKGNNNFIKVLKGIEFGFRSFRWFKARIMISKALVKISKKKANAFRLAS